MWSDVPVHEPEPGWELLPENGWFAMIGWVAGLANLRRFPGSDVGRTVRVTCIEHGSERTYLEPFGAEDRADVDESVNGYLADAGIPPRPSGFDWYLRVPEGWPGESAVPDALSSRILQRQRASETRPDQVLEIMESIVGGFYVRGRTRRGSQCPHVAGYGTTRKSARPGP
ncbi:DUF5956 family protein [Paeniglutamicibacter kerguelensis]|uniref:DUF317 domain-containing protein n=1 Tax=Paeniglutamicibacter kerguelensis TaxID=254788 RepID=A0ABS4XDL0_9MICC|nr:hypothetical protein [Paeniglutamicibacter kerguelensis]